MPLFGLGKKTEEPVQATTPVDEVLRMREQGFSNNQIVQALQRSGYKTHQIFDAMNQADLKSAGPIEGAVPPDMAQPMQDQTPAAPADDNSVPDLPEESEPAAQAPGYNEEQIEEVAEAIIEEKWEDLMKNINKLLEWKESIENKMAALEQSNTDLKSNFSDLQKGIIGKVAEYDKTMKDVGVNMKAMDNVFQKVLPSLTNNVSELARITRNVKAKK